MKTMKTDTGNETWKGLVRQNMTRAAMPSPYDRIHFATMALESGAQKLGITPLIMYRRLKQQDLIHQRLIRHYDMLHTQSLDYVAEDIAETLQNWEAQS